MSIIGAGRGATKVSNDVQHLHRLLRGTLEDLSRNSSLVFARRTGACDTTRYVSVPYNHLDADFLPQWPTMPASGTRKPYIGTARSLVLALDVGTTFSGVSYAILEPGEVPKIHGVTRYPGQEHVAGNSKIPSIMYYDKLGHMVAAGAEAENASIVAEAEDENWVKAELFKLRLRPKTMKLKMNGMRLAPLPRHKTAVDVFGDFLAYLFRCTHSFIVDTHANGHALWDAVKNDIQFVLSHPNGWEGAQQTKMRHAAVYGGLIPDTDEGKARIRFVTEGEASLHACVLNGLAADVLSNPSGHGFIVADAGGGTLDISSYAIRGTAPLVIEEIAPPDCVFAGSVFVSRRARLFFEEKLKTSKYGTPDSLDHITKRFDETTKRLFRDNKELQFVPFGSPLDRDMTVGIRGGQLKLTGAEVAALFEPSIEAAIASIKSQIDASAGVVKSVWLVGGFAASPWLFSQLQERLAPLHVTVSRPDTQTSKAVADGAIGFYCDHHVSARMSKFMYGVEYLREFDANNEEHVARQHRLFELPSGPKLLPDAFDCILARSVKVKESTVFSRKYCTEVTSLSTLSVFEVEIWCFRGGDVIPKWILRDAEHFSTLCYVRADLSPLAGSAQAKQGKNGKMYWLIVFSIEIHFGLTEFRARIKWTDNGRVKYGPASIVYNESGHRAEEDEPDGTPDDNVTVVSSQSDRHPSQPSSRPPSRDPMSSQSTLHSTHASPRLPSDPVSRGFEVERSSRPASLYSTVRASLDKGKQREVIPEAPEGLRELDRSINVSGRSADSAKSGNTRLGEALNSVWGAMSKHQTPAASPFSNGSSLSSAAIPEEEPRVATPKEPSKAPIPREVSKAPSPKEVSKALTPKEVSKAPTPQAASKAPTPPAVSKVPSKVPTPKEASKAPTPKATSKAPTPQATSKVATPKSLSRVATPKSTSKVGTPKVEAETLAETKPATPVVEAALVLEPTAAEPPAHTDPLDTGTEHAMPGALPTETSTSTAPDPPAEQPPPVGLMSPIADLWSNAIGDNAPTTSAGLFSNSLSTPSWKTPSLSFGAGLSGGGFGSLSEFGWGSTAPQPPSTVVDSAAAEKEAEEKRMKEEEEKKKLEEEEQRRIETEAEKVRQEEEERKRLEAEKARQEEEKKHEEAEAAEKKRLEEEEAVKKAEEEKKAAEAAETQRREDERLTEEARVNAEEEKRQAEEARQKAETEAEEQRKAEEAAAEEAKKEEELKAQEEAEKAKEEAEQKAKEEEAKEEEEATKAQEAEAENQKQVEEEETKPTASKKKKKKGAASAAATPDPISRTTSTAAPTTPAASSKPLSKSQKKKAKQKGNKVAGQANAAEDDDDKTGGDATEPVTPGETNASPWGGEGGGNDDGWEMA